MRKVILFIVSILFSNFVAAEVERHALVIGNSNYTTSPLFNPRNDAEDMAAQLKMMGYQIHGGEAALDLDRPSMHQTINAFASQLPENAHALVYYAGHGVATESDNFLVPLNHGIEYEEMLDNNAVGLRSLVNRLKRANPDGLNMVLLDACRDNPLRSNFRSSTVGLNRLRDVPNGVFIGYAADSGQVAADGFGRNGTYTGELLAVMREKPDLIIELAHKEVAERVYRKTNFKQSPVSESQVYGNWCFGNCGDPIASTTPFASASTTQSSSEPGSASTSVSGPTQPSIPKPKSNRRYFYIGGAIVALLAVGFAASSSGGASNQSSDTGNFTLELTPP